jgi:5-methylcytosine-specific restriction endonuclease McrA
VSFSKDMLEAVLEQLHDNNGALYARLQCVALQVSGCSSYEIDRINLRNDLVAIYCECSPIPISAITDNFGLNSEELLEVYHAEPISLFSCLQCRDALPEGNLRVLRSRSRTLYFLSRVEIGAPVELRKLQELLCEVCEQGLNHCLEEERRAQQLTVKTRQNELRAMSYPEYLKTREWQAKRNRALIRAGNRCQLCGSTARLDVHHNHYYRRGYELLEDLVVLCRSCHEHFHEVLPKAA